MRVLLAGASGAIGKRLVPLLIAAGHDVTGITRAAGSLSDTGADELVADVLDRVALFRAIGETKFDAIINELTELSRAPTHYFHMRATNRLRSEGTNTLIAVARKVGATKFVTASLFLGYGPFNHGQELMKESMTFAELTGGPLDAVHRALLSNEQQVRAFGGVVLRYGLFYGTGSGAFVPTKWQGELPFVHIEDAAAATVLALEHGTSGAVYNIVDDDPATWAEVHTAHAVAQGVRKPVALPTWVLRLFAPYAAVIIASTSMRVSANRAKTELHWEPKYPSYLDGMRASVKVADSDPT